MALGGSDAAESFENAEPGSSLNGQASGGGWASSWRGSRFDRVFPHALSYSSGSISLDGGKLALRFPPDVEGAPPADNTRALLRRQIEEQGATFYVRFLFEREGEPSGTDEFVGLALGDLSAGWNADLPPLEVTHRVRQDGAYSFGVKIGPRVNAAVSATKPGVCYLLVAKISNAEGNTDMGFNRIELFVNPKSQEEPKHPDALVTARDILVKPNWLGIRFALFDGQDATYWIDDLKLSASWKGAVTP